jgi:hypothetical protein
MRRARVAVEGITGTASFDGDVAPAAQGVPSGTPVWWASRSLEQVAAGPLAVEK